MRDSMVLTASVFFSALLYLFIGYDFVRSETAYLIFSFGLLFFMFILIMFKKPAVFWIFFIGVIFRFVFIFSVPSLSQDFYRFFWDGNLQLIGENPYLYSPNQIIDRDNLFSLAIELYKGMGSISNENYSNYPPFSQFTYLLSSILIKNNLYYSIITLRIIIIIFEIGVFYYLYKLLNHLNVPSNRVGFYFLNPLIIIELTGNLHGEGIMMFFFLAGLYMLIKNKFFRSSILLSISVATKLITFILLPIMIKKFEFKKKIKFFISFLIFSTIIWAPYLNLKLFTNYFNTIMLWFNKFEFNASIFYVIREIGFYFKGYNIIQEFSIFSILFLISAILFFSYFKKNNSIKEVLISQLFLLSFYFFISTTVHPWYITSLVCIGLLTPYFYPIIWSGLILLTYSSYGAFSFEEKPIVIIFEYVTVFCLFLIEFNGNKDRIFNAFVKNPSPLK